ncbi:hypothetical protein Tco_1539286 [Tanacetum coccineum]
MCTYLMNMARWKPKDLKNKSFANIQELFDKAMKRVNTFVDMDTELVEGSEVRAEGSATREESRSKRARDELEQEKANKQKVDKDKEIVELQSLMEVNPDEEEVAVDAIPLATKPPSIVDYKIIKEGKISNYQIIRADGSSKSFLSLSQSNSRINEVFGSILLTKQFFRVPTKENGVTRSKKYSELSAMEAIQADCDIKATNIILQGLPPEVYALVSNHKVAKELWERIQLLMQGTSLTKQERECKLYDEFDKFAYKKGEIIRDFYLRFSLLLNDMNIYNMKLEQFQVNTKFLNTLPPE